MRNYTNGGEAGIRTLGWYNHQRFSRPPHSTALAPLRTFINHRQPLWLYLSTFFLCLNSLKNAFRNPLHSFVRTPLTTSRR